MPAMFARGSLLSPTDCCVRKCTEASLLQAPSSPNATVAISVLDKRGSVESLSVALAVRQQLLRLLSSSEFRLLSGRARQDERVLLLHAVHRHDMTAIMYHALLFFSLLRYDFAIFSIHVVST